jgi:hypothetical protein
MWFGWNYFGGALALLIYLGMASQSGRFFVDAQRSGLTELMLATPLTVKEIVQGHWRAILRRFGWPLLLCVLVQVAGSAAAQAITSARMASMTAAAPTPVATTNATGGSTVLMSSNSAVVITTTSGPGTNATQGGMKPPMALMIAASSVAGLLTVVGNLLALGWFGMWMGLNSKSTSLATLKTIALVQVAPWFGISFVSAMAGPLLLMPSMMRGNTPNITVMLVWYPLIASGVSALLYLGKNLAFIWWARRRIYGEFRTCSTRSPAPMPITKPPPLVRATTA